MLAQRLQSWANIHPTLDQRLIFTGSLQNDTRKIPSFSLIASSGFLFLILAVELVTGKEFAPTWRCLLRRQAQLQMEVKIISDSQTHLISNHNYHVVLRQLSTPATKKIHNSFTTILLQLWIVFQEK